LPNSSLPSSHQWNFMVWPLTVTIVFILQTTSLSKAFPVHSIIHIKNTFSLHFTIIHISLPPPSFLLFAFNP
jgi:hypothetical protein